MNLISLTPSRQIDECNAHSMELYAPTGKVWLFLVISTTVGELEVEEGLGTPSSQKLGATGISMNMPAGQQFLRCKSAVKGRPVWD